MVVLIVSLSSTLLIYCLLHLYNFLFTIDFRFSIRFRSEFDCGYSIISVPVSLSPSENSPVNSGTWEGTLQYMNINFSLKLRDLYLYHAKKALSIKLQNSVLLSLTPSSDLHGLIMTWSTKEAHIITLPPISCLFLAIGSSELEKIHLFTHSSGLSNFTRDLFRFKLLNRKVSFHVFLGPNMRF